MTNESTIQVPTLRDEQIELVGRLNLELVSLIAARKASNRRTTKIGKAIETKTEDLSKVIAVMSGQHPGEQPMPLFEGQNEEHVSIGGVDGKLDKKPEPAAKPAPKKRASKRGTAKAK